jgi:putative membrane protein
MTATRSIAAMSAFLLAAVTISAAQSGGATSSQTRPPTTQAAPSEFVKRMALAGLAEVQLGHLALKQGAHAEVKAFGEMMVKDHSQANAELATIAKAMQVETPKQLDQKHRALVDRLSKLKGPDFDREYIAAMVQGHEDVLSQLKSFAAAQQTSSGERSATATPAGATGRTGGGATGSERRADAARAGGAIESGRQLMQWATKTMPVVEKHLERARAIEENVK